MTSVFGLVPTSELYDNSHVSPAIQFRLPAKSNVSSMALDRGLSRKVVSVFPLPQQFLLSLPLPHPSDFVPNIIRAKNRVMHNKEI